METFEPSREEQLTEQHLKWGYWWLTHKQQVRKWTSVALAVVDVLLIGNFLFWYADWFFGSGVRERQNLAQLSVQYTDHDFFRSQNAPRALSFGGVTQAGAAGAYDFSAEVRNDNRLWWAEFDYSFRTTAGDTPAQRGFVLPLESKPVMALGYRQPAGVTVLDVVITNVTWNRVNQHDTRPALEPWLAERLHLLAESPTFSSPTANDPVPASRARFDAVNATAYGYYRVGYLVTLYSGQRVVGLNKVTISELRPGERRPVEAAWFSDVGGVTAVQVVPEVNVFDPRIYIAPGQ